MTQILFLGNYDWSIDKLYSMLGLVTWLNIQTTPIYEISKLENIYFIWAPAFRRVRTVSTCPWVAARWRAELPFRITLH